MSVKPQVICLIGPTAIGKTSLAIELYQQGLPIDIISVDSAMIYKGLDIGSGKPSKAILVKIPHYLVDIREPYEIYTVADFCTDAIKLIKQSHANNRVPLLVGGTMMYFNALFNGLAKLPSSNQEIREDYYQQIATNGLDSLHLKLAAIDPIAAQKINPNDSQRIIRALEVYQVSGKCLTQWLSQDTVNEFNNFQSINFIMAPEDSDILPSKNTKQNNTRLMLHQAIATRFHQMLADGFIDEVKVLFDNPKITMDLPALKSCGYQQAWQYLLGEIDQDTMIEKSIITTRQLAKRQLTWLRSGYKTWDNTHWFNIYNNNLDYMKAEIIKVLNF